MCGTPKRLRRLAEIAQEGAAHAARISEASALCDAVKWCATVLDQNAGGFKAQTLNCLGWRAAGFP